MFDQRFQPTDSMARKSIFFWQYSIEHHTYFTCRSLQKLSNNSIEFVLGLRENETRKAQGWASIDLSPLNVLMLPPGQLQKTGRKILKENMNSIHVFNGFRGAKGYNYFPLILYALRNGIKTVVLNEPFSINPTGYFIEENDVLASLKVMTRPSLYRGMAILIKMASKNVTPCIMPISLVAKQQFMKSGFGKESLFPFGYFVPKQEGVQNTPDNQSGVLKIVFVGTMLRRKGMDILQEALTEIRQMGFSTTLDIYGPGDYREFEDPKHGIHHRGTKPIFQMQSIIANYDVLVLPSRHDGWGSVVNEALLQGVPVIASDRVGAKCLLENGDCGLIFRSEDSSDLANKIAMLIKDQELRERLKINAREIGEKISPEHASQYFLNVLEYHFYGLGKRPVSIWCDGYR